MAEEYKVIEIDPKDTVADIQTQLNVEGTSSYVLKGIIQATEFRNAIAILEKTVP